jgi:PEP-CTERM/exosortase A-associated glycosyltransferase
MRTEARRAPGAPVSLRILHVLDHSIPLHSGYTFRTRGILREQQRLGWETDSVTSPKHVRAGPPEETVEGLRFYRTPAPEGAAARLPLVRELALMRATGARLLEVAQRVQPDIIHAHSPVLNALPALRVGRRLGVPVVYEVRAFWEDAAVDHGTSTEGGARYRATRALETYALRHVDHVTAICEGLKHDIIARGLDPARVTVIPNAVDVASFAFDPPPDLPLQRELGLDGAVVLGFIGSFYAYEGLDLLLQALPAIAQRIPSVKVLLVGGGPEEQRLRALAQATGMAERVVFTGRVPNHDVQRYYSIVDILTYPRLPMRLTELVTPLKPLEAMAQGRLFVASDVGGHRELIRDGETGALFRAGDAAALADAVERLWRERERWGDLRRRARHFVERERTWAASVARYRDVYGSLRGTLRPVAEVGVPRPGQSAG